MTTPSIAGNNSATINASPMAGVFEWVQMLAPGEAQSQIAVPLMLTQINHGLVFDIPAEPDFVITADEHFVLAPEYG